MSKRLTDKERAEVVSDYASGKTKSEIARKFKVSPNAISKILSNFKSSKIEKKFKARLEKFLLFQALFYTLFLTSGLHSNKPCLLQ